MGTMAWMNRGPRVGATPEEQLEWFRNLYTDLIQFSHGIEVDNVVNPQLRVDGYHRHPDAVDSELIADGLHLDWFSMASILPHLDTSAWPKHGRMMMVEQIQGDIEGISSITDEELAKGFPPVDALIHLLMCIDPTLTGFCWCLQRTGFMEEADGEFRLTEDHWWNAVYGLVSLSKDLRILPQEGTMWENVEPRSEEEHNEYFLLLSNIHSELESMLDDWFKHREDEIPSSYESHRECFETNFDADSEEMMRYFGFDFEDYFSRKEA